MKTSMIFPLKPPVLRDFPLAMFDDTGGQSELELGSFPQFFHCKPRSLWIFFRPAVLSGSLQRQLEI